MQSFGIDDERGHRLAQTILCSDYDADFPDVLLNFRSV
jgi:hypothetical protein